MIKAVIFDLDNTLLDFIKMKQNAVRAAVSAMQEAGLNLNTEKSYKDIFSLYEEIGWENQKIFNEYLTKTLGYVDNKFLALDSLEFRKHLNKITPGVDMGYEYTCSSCDHTQEVVVPLGTGFFWPNAS